MIGILSKENREKESPKTAKARAIESVPTRVKEVNLPETVYKLYDPEKRTFRDEIVINGEKKQRTVIDGLLKTIDREIMNFHLQKGWILLPESNEEANHG